MFGLEVGGRWDAETASFLRLLARARAFATQAVLHRQPGCSDGVASLLLLRSGRNHAAPKIRIACLRSEMRGVPAGPSGATNEHLHILLDDEGDTQLLHRAACRLARADLPPPFLAVLRVGRITALQKPTTDAASAPSSSAMCFGAWSAARWPKRLRHNLNVLVSLTSLA